ncbi:hypothetical protein ACTFIY_009759 [Dictyostelium cf. discoideum]
MSSNQNGGKFFKRRILYLLIIFFIFFINLIQCDIVIKWDNPIESEITISVGDQVTWITTDGLQHTVTSIRSIDIVNKEEILMNQINSKEINNNANLNYYTNSNNKYFQIINSSTFSKDSYTKSKHSVTFTREGIYTYHCKYHNQTMLGSIRVLSSSSSMSNDIDRNQNSKKSLLSLLFATLLALLIFFVLS